MRRVTPLPALLATALAVLALSIFAPVASAATVANGGFESGLTGWTQANHGGEWGAVSGTTSPLSGRPVKPPVEGTLEALADQNDEEQASMILYQDVLLGAGETHQLSLQLSYRSDGPMANPGSLEVTSTEVGGVPEVQPNQQVRVDVMKPGAPIDSVQSGDILETLFATTDASPQEIDWTTLGADLTRFAGQTVRIRIAVVAAKNTVNAGVDAVSIASQPVRSSEPETQPTVISGPAAESPPLTGTQPTHVVARCVAPKLKGLSLKAAKEAIRAARCGVGHIGRKRGVTAATGVVIRQSRRPGTTAAAGAKVAIRLG